VTALRHPDWYLISEQRFRRRAAVTWTRQVFRGETFIVISDRVTGQHMRLGQRAQDLWELLDGKRTAQQLWDHLSTRPASAPTQGELVEWIMQLVSSGYALSDHDLDPVNLSERAEKKRSGMIEQKAASPLSIKVKLFDPNTLIRVTYPFVAPIFTRTGAVLIGALFLTALVFVAVNVDALVQSVDSAILSQSGLIALVLAYPIIKVLHELGHGYAVHRFGGEVRELGVMFLVFFPVPYVEASEASRFPNKYARMLVGGAGIIAELIIASIAFLAWLQIEPGLERALLFNFMLIGSISTVLFNGNPLLKFDAYFVLADFLEMPNLATRSGEYLSDRFLARFLGLRRQVFPRPGEAKILAIYGVLSLAYRTILTLTIALIVSNWFFVIGTLLAMWAIIMGVVWPLFKTAKKGFKMARTQNRTRRASVRLAILLTVVIGVGFFVQIPFSAPGAGQITPLPSAELRIGTSGELLPGLIEEGAMVGPDTVVAQVINRPQSTRARALELNVEHITAALERSGLNVTQRQELERSLEIAVASLNDIIVLQDALLLHAPLSGQIAWIGGRSPLPGSFVFRGDLLGYVVAPEALQIVLAFPAAYTAYLDQGDAVVEMLLPNGVLLEQSIARTRVVDVGQQVPRELLSSAGGTVPEMPGTQGMALDTVWVAWITPDLDLSDYAGSRVEARIVLEPATLARQIQFHLRRLFLRVARV
jgi:putative peptide zinc metalloprotease protein